MVEYGIFNTEGCCERQFYTRAAAEAALALNWSEDDAHVGECSLDQDGVEAGFEDETTEEEDEDEDDYEYRDPDYDTDIDFADPGGQSALRAASARNPRNLPCPTCEEPNKLTPADRARGYQCDACANAIERGF